MSDSNAPFNDKKANTSAKVVLHHLMISLVIVLIAGLISVPIWIFGIKGATDYVHFAQSKLAMSVSDIATTSSFESSPKTFGIVDPPTVVGGECFGRIYSKNSNVDCNVLYGANRVCLRSGAGASTEYSLPGFGKTTILTGYNSTVFKNLNKVKKGDIFDFETKWGKFSYRVSDIKVYSANDSVDMQYSQSESLVIFTTYSNEPFAFNNNQRLYIFCDKASGPAVEVKSDEQ